VEAGFTYQPTNALQLSVFPNLSLNRDQLQWVNNLEVDGDPRYLNGTITQETFSLSLRLNYTINPNLTIQYWGQPFISQGTYSDFKSITDPLAVRFEDRFRLYGPDEVTLNEGLYEVDENQDGQVDFSFTNPDFSFIQFRSNLVVRWEYIPGSELFLVWSQDLTTSGDPSTNLLPDLESNIFGTGLAQNIFLIKATYRFAF
jgi:hypothetical protein